MICWKVSVQCDERLMDIMQAASVSVPLRVSKLMSVLDMKGMNIWVGAPCGILYFLCHTHTFTYIMHCNVQFCQSVFSCCLTFSTTPCMSVHF